MGSAARGCAIAAPVNGERINDTVKVVPEINKPQSRIGAIAHQRVTRTVKLSVACLLVWLSSAALAAGPGTISYQGQAVTPDGKYPIRFSLWDDPTEGDKLWTELHDSEFAPDVLAGLLNADLGSKTDFPPNLFLNFDNIYLQVEIDLDADGFEPEEVYLPRVSVTSVPWAIQSDRAQKITELFPIEAGEPILPGDVVSLTPQGRVRRGSGSPFSPEIVFHQGNTGEIKTAVLSEDRVVIAYTTGWPEIGAIIIATIGDDGVSFSAPLTFRNDRTINIIL